MSGLPFATPFDEAVATSGVAALFTLDHKGELRLTSDRSRDAWNTLQAAPVAGWTHCLLRDHGTGWVQYALATSPDLVARLPRADVWRFASFAEATAALAAFGRPPIHRGPFGT
jgi:hypothetical protein